ncbi:hypothetical protein, partial [Brachyspira sp.]|uniref:hypothetical protein n=1 Tax=Brachyspira sp. TaxID=1977261 RepID=UPI0026067224
MKKNNSVKNTSAVNNFQFDEAYDKDKWLKHLGDTFQQEYGAISNEEEILEKNKDFLNKVIWIGDLNTDDGEVIGVYEVYITNTRL